MLKKMILLLAFGITISYASDVPKTGLIKRIKNSSVTSKIVGGIVPCIAIMVSMEIIGRTYKGIPDKKSIVTAAHYIKCIALGVALVFYDWIVKFHIKKKLLELKKQHKKSKQTKVIPSYPVPVTT